MSGRIGVSVAFDPRRWNVLISNWSGFGVYRIGFEGTLPCFFTPVAKVPAAGLGAVFDGVGGRGLIVRISLPPEDFAAASSPAMRNYMHRFRARDDAGGTGWGPVRRFGTGAHCRLP